MDYRYLKEEVENEKNLIRKNFEEEYENQEKELVERICKKIINQVKGAVKTYYSSSEEVKNRMCMHVIKKPTLFRRNWLYEANAQDVIHKIKESSSNIHVYSCINYYDCEIPCVNVPEKNFARFYSLLNQSLKNEDMRVELEFDESNKWYNIKVTADLGRL